MMNRSHALALAALLLALAVPAAAQTADAPLGVKEHAEEGIHLVAGNGFAIYLFEADTKGAADGSGAVSACEGDCLAAWPPVVLEGEPVAGEGVDEDLLGTLARSDGTMQLTYNGWPLYFYAADETEDDIKGHDIEEFGAEWYLIGPNGERAEH